MGKTAVLAAALVAVSGLSAYAQYSRAPVAGNGAARVPTGPMAPPSASWPAAFEGLALGLSLRSPLHLAPLVRVLENSGVTEEAFRAAPIDHRQAWTTQARRFAEAEAQNEAAEVLRAVATADLAKAKAPELQKLAAQVSVLNETWGPYLSVPVKGVVDALERRFEAGVREERREKLIASVRATIAALGLGIELPQESGGSTEKAKGKEADPLVPGLPASAISVGAGASADFHVRERQVALVDLTGKEGGHHVRLARLNSGQLTVIYGTGEIGRLSPGQSLEIGRDPGDSSGQKLALMTHADPLVKERHAVVRYRGDGTISVTDLSGGGVSVAAAIGGANAISGRYSGILGRVFAAYNDRSTYGELLRLSMTGRLAALYDEVRAAGSESSTELDWVNLVVQAVVREIPSFSMAQALALSDAHRTSAGDFGEAVLGGKGGVCRQYALAIASLLEQLTVDGVLRGRAYYAAGALEGGESGHAWAEYESENGQVYVLDPAQGVYGPSHEREFHTGDGDIKRPYAAVSFPAENR
ncbi:MAG: hypothetical protein HY925_09320 [Elusimicrobia bacterium]|nr:hypothetical protein [Elusimicrobiota bacterium]